MDDLPLGHLDAADRRDLAEQEPAAAPVGLGVLDGAGHDGADRSHGPGAADLGPRPRRAPDQREISADVRRAARGRDGQHVAVGDPGLQRPGDGVDASLGTQRQQDESGCDRDHPKRQMARSGTVRVLR